MQPTNPSNSTSPRQDACKSKAHQDQKYITALPTNDIKLLDELYQKCSGKMKQMVLQNNGTETDAANIFQDTLLPIFHQAKTQDFILTCPMEAFLYRVCKNRWITKLNKRKLNKVVFTDIEDYKKIAEDSFKIQEEALLQKKKRKFIGRKVFRAE